MGCGSSTDKGAAGGLSTSGASRGGGEAAAAAAALCGGAVEFTSEVEVSISCKGLPNKDLTSKSDPMAVLSQASAWGRKDYSELARSDIVKNTQDPAFSKPLRARYNFEALQPMRVAVYDVDTAASSPEALKLDQQDYLGDAEFLLSDLMLAPSRTLQLPLRCKRGGQHGSTVTLRAEELANVNLAVTLAFSATGLDNKDTFGKSDPFLRVSKLRESGDWVPVLRTEVVDNNLSPAWRPIEVDIRQLCNADDHRPLKLEVFDYDADGSHDLIGECRSSLGQLKALAGSAAQGLDLVNPKKTGRPGYQRSGVLSVREVSVRPRPSFLQYLAGGMQVSFQVAIDFTGSNGNPRHPHSLHYLSAAPTQYEQAIMAVGRVLEGYDADRSFPVFGFGAGLPPSGAVSHCFSLGASPAQPEVQGVQGILEAYRRVLPTITLSGPTLFAPIINTAAAIARQAAEGPRLSYFVLLILTDGCIMDMGETKRAIIEASRLPLSLLIVGIGGADFDAMEELDADKRAVRVGGHTAARDIVQFVALRECRGGAQALARQLLAEIPGQVVTYFDKIKGIAPPASPWQAEAAGVTVQGPTGSAVL